MRAVRLEVIGVSKRFGGLQALANVSFTAESGELTAIIGPNGAGKTTLFSCIAGSHRADSGQILLDSDPITNLPPAKVLRRGLARTFQLVRSFEGLTVLETVMTAGHARSGQGFAPSVLVLPHVRHSEAVLEQEARATLAALGIEGLAGQYTHELPYGQQRLVEIAKVLATGAEMLLLDEPAAGLHASEAHSLAAAIRGIQASGRTLIMIEHNMPFLMSLAQRIVVLEFGQKIAEGTPDAIRRNPDVVRAYLGGAGHVA